MEEHGGASPNPAAPDAVFIGAGAALDGGLQAVKVPALPRLVADAALAWAVRFPKWGGRTEGAHLLVVSGAFISEFVGVVVRHHP